MIRIGDFSKVSRVSVKTLRYYDEMGLLRPIHVDSLTGYRYYEFHQLPRLNRILVLKDLGFSLEEVGRLLAENPSLERLMSMMRQRQEEAQKQMLEDAARLERVERLLTQIEKEASMSNYDVVIKRVELLKVASIRGVVPTPPQQGVLWEELMHYLSSKRAGMGDPCVTLYYDEEYKEKDWDVEVCQPISADLAESGRVKVHTLPAVESMASTVHHGSLASIQEAYTAIMKWIDDNGYRICGPGREVYLRSAANQNQGNGVMVSQSDAEAVTEVQFPVQKAG